MDERKSDDLEETFEPTGEDNLDEENLDHVEAQTQSKIKTLQAKLKVAQQEKSEHLEALQRTKAEFLNARKRLETSFEADKERVINDCIERILPLCDSFYMAMQNKEAWESVDESWRKGVESIANQLNAILTSYDVAQFGTVGDQFDPTDYEALGNEIVKTEADVDTVVKIIQPGYVRTKDGRKTVIRPARVIVGTL